MPDPGRDPFGTSYNFMVSVLMVMFVIAIAFAIIGATSPNWLGFS